MAKTQFYKNIEEWRRANGRSPIHGFKLEGDVIPARDADAPIEMSILALACKVAANQSKRGDLWAEYRRMAARLEEWKSRGIELLDLVDE